MTRLERHERVVALVDKYGFEAVLAVSKLKRTTLEGYIKTPNKLVRVPQQFKLVRWEKQLDATVKQTS